jgi:hypothetical protein
VKDDLFLYQDQLWTWDSGSATIKTPYAWNPSCSLYGYRRSLEGLVAPLRTLSTWYPLGGGYPNITSGSDAEAVDAVNPLADPANLPLWKNSFPPTSRMISKNHLVLCTHCFNLQVTNRQNLLNQTLAGLYPAGGYLDTVMRLRFIDGDNNVIELPKSSFEYPYVRDEPPQPPIEPQKVKKGVAMVYGYTGDTAISVLTNGSFPLNPITSIHAGSIPPRQNLFYLNAGNMVLCEVVNCGAGTGGAFYPTGVGDSQGATGITLQDAYPSDDPFLHDSGSLFLYPVKAPSSVAAGDGIMGVVFGHIRTNYGDPLYEQAPIKPAWITKQPAWTDPNPQDLQEFRQYWINRGYPYPEILKIDPGAEKKRVTKTQIDDLDTQVSGLLSLFS